MRNHDYKFKPSLIYAGLLALVTLGSFVIIAALQLPLWVKCLLLLWVAVYVSQLCWQVLLLRGDQAITQLNHQQDGSWYLITASQIRSAQLLGDSTVTPWVCVLRFKVDNAFWPRTCLVFRDAMSAKEYKHLMMTVRMT